MLLREKEKIAKTFITDSVSQRKRTEKYWNAQTKLLISIKKKKKKEKTKEKRSK